MKRKLLIGLVLICAIFTTACGKKEKHLECTMKVAENNGIAVDQIVTFDFQGVKVLRFGMQMDYILNDELVSNIDVIESTMIDQFKDEYKKGIEDGVITLTNKKTDNKVEIDLNFELADMSEENLKELGIDVPYDTYDNTKSYFEKSGYTCK